MHRHQVLGASVALAGLLLAGACQSIDVDENDRDALFVEGRVRKELKRDEDGTATFVEAGWTSLRGETSQLDYAIDTLTLGGGLDFPAGEQGHVEVGGGLAWQLNDLEIAPADNDDHNGFGPFLTGEAGWRLAPWLEPYARVIGAFYVDEADTMTSFEAGLRLHASENAALCVGWRYATYEMDDFDGGALTIDEIELDASGVVVGLLLSF